MVANANAGSTPITLPSVALSHEVPCPLQHRFGVPLPGLRSGPEVAYMCGSTMSGFTRKDELERGIWVEQIQNSTLTPRRGPPSSTITIPEAAARANMVTSMSSRHRPCPTRRCAGSSSNQSMGNPRTFGRPMPRAGSIETITSPKVN